MADRVTPDRTGASSGSVVGDSSTVERALGRKNIEGYDEFRAALREFGAQWPKALRNINKRAADAARDFARQQALSMGGIWAAAAKAIVARANQYDARVGVNASSKTTPFGGAAFWGMKRRTGWYAYSRFKDSPKPQHPPWVGNTWKAASRTEGPYAINAALADHLDEILDIYSQEIESLMNEVLPPWRQGQLRRGIQ